MMMQCFSLVLAVSTKGILHNESGDSTPERTREARVHIQYLDEWLKTAYRAGTRKTVL